LCCRTARKKKKKNHKKKIREEHSGDTAKHPCKFGCNGGGPNNLHFIRFEKSLSSSGRFTKKKKGGESKSIS
jgi:hypothetical protein